MDLSQLSPTNKNETLLLEMVNLLHKMEKNTHTKPHKTLKFKMTKPKQGFNFDNTFIILEKWFMGVS